MFWVDDTRDVPIERYLALQDCFYEHFRSASGATCFGNFGSIRAPGLSDLDLIVVVEDESLINHSFNLPEINSEKVYIMIHSPIVVPASLLQHLPYYNITWADGNLNSPCYAIDEHNPINICIQVLFKTFDLQSALWRLLLRRRNRCRRAFIRLFSLVHSIKYLESIDVPLEQSYTIFAESVAALRSGRHELRIYMILLCVTCPMATRPLLANGELG